MGGGEEVLDPPQSHDGRLTPPQQRSGTFGSSAKRLIRVLILLAAIRAVMIVWRLSGTDDDLEDDYESDH